MNYYLKEWKAFSLPAGEIHCLHVVTEMKVCSMNQRHNIACLPEHVSPLVGSDMLMLVTESGLRCWRASETLSRQTKASAA